MEENGDNNTFAFTAEPDAAGKRLDAFLAEKIGDRSRSQLQRSIDSGEVLVNGRTAKASYKIRSGDEIDVELVDGSSERFEPENIPLDIVFEDAFLAVINKPAGMVVHPGAGVSGGTLANAIAYHFSVDAATSGSGRVGIVHRLDKGTSGLLVVAKNENVHEHLAEQFRSRSVSKRYAALVHGVPAAESGVIDRPIARDRWHRTKMTVAANGREAYSSWTVRQRFEKFALVGVKIKTGRTHQIRVHLASINHPVVGDPTYNEGRDNTIANIDIKKAVEKLDRVFLHAEHLAFDHPVTGERLAFSCELPPELKALLEKLV